MPEYGQRFVSFAKPKCGTTTVLRWMTEHDRASRRAGQHDPAARNRGLRTNRRAVAPDRNPLTWYPSLYAHFWATVPSWGRGPEVLDDAFGGRDFRAVLYGLTHGVCADRVGLVTEAGTPQQFAESGVGLATWLSWWTYGDRAHHTDAPQPGDPWAVEVIVPQDRLAEGYGRILGADVGTERRNERRGARYMPADYREWYDAEMVSWVMAADWPLFALLGVDGWGASPQPIVYTTGRNLAGGAL